MLHKYRILPGINFKKLIPIPLGTVIKDNDGIKWQLIRKSEWVKYKYSYIHKTTPGVV
jgi:hypothetical protein